MTAPANRSPVAAAPVTGSQQPSSVPPPAGEKPAGRERQRRRTRKAILQATIELMASGGTPSVAEVAEAADVSKRTVYLHFPTHEQLLIDAALGMLDWDTIEAEVERFADPVDRAAATVRALTRVTPETERAGRQLVRLTVDEPSEPSEPGEPGEPRRGYRRVALLERALEPARDRLTPGAFEQLVTALSMVSGFEAMIVQRDVRGLDADQGSAASEWAARALVRAALHEPGD
jgi:AcrR family transcriptional regulator